MSNPTIATGTAGGPAGVRCAAVRPTAPVPTVLSAGGLVATADQQATAAGVVTLARGGNAVDAAIAANGAMAVVAPHLCGMGGDLFALVHAGGSARPVALAAVGAAGAGADAATLRSEGHRLMPFKDDIRTVTVPGCVDGWVTLHARFGRLPLTDVLAPAVALAAGGFAASPLLVASTAANLAPHPAPGAEELVVQATRSGVRVHRPGVARTLGAVGAGGRDAFYGGEFGAGLLTLGAGHFSSDDLSRPQARWVEPLAAPAFGRVLWTVPPPSQGYLTLAAAWIADGLDLPDDPDDGGWAHLLVEAAIAAGHDRDVELHDAADGAALIDPARLAPRRAALARDRRAHWPQHAGARDGDTTYLCVVDRDGMGVSLIQSNASGFGSHLFEPSTGINLHNRGLGFSLEPGHPAELAPGRQPPHTLSPALATHPDGALAAVFGTMGGDAQPQILLQVAARLFRHGQSPGRAIGSPRWVLGGEGTGFDTWRRSGGPAVHVERDAPPAWSDELARLGHDVVTVSERSAGAGHAQAIVVTADGTLAGAADPRTVVGSASGM